LENFSGGIYMEVSGFQMMLGLALGVIVLIFLVLKTKIHAFLGLIIAASITGLVGGMAAPDVVNAITAGFGTTLGSIGIVIGFGVMMGRILEVSGAAEKMAYSIVKWLGKRKEEWAMAITGYIVSIPIFVDSAFVILTPLVKALSKKTGKSVLTLGVALGVGLVATHHAVPPTPGPLGVAGIFGVDVGLMAIWGLIFAIPIMIIGVIYAKWLGKKIYQIPDESGLGYVRQANQSLFKNSLNRKRKKICLP
jgi:gluconate:H+ symporter, GntP family